ncbi:MAG: DUF6118 family protein [Gammaproteobacteria bacterium]|nr:DUF6118 family protein [Gammaproteobacteria bacterium]
MSETDPYDEDDATEITSVERIFRQINENIETLNRNLDASTRTLGALVKSEYAGELARLGKSVNDLVQKQAGIAKTIDEQQKAVQSLRDASQSLKGQDVKLAGVTRDLEALGQEMDEIVARPAASAEQRANLRMWTAIGFLSGLFLVFCGLWALPYRAETVVARVIMSDSYWDSAWRMMDMFSVERADGMRVLTWVDAGLEEAEKHKACRDRAWESGKHQECTVIFRPRRGG